MDEDLKRLIEALSVATHRPFDDVARDVQRPFDVTAGDFRQQLQLVSGCGYVVNERIVQLTRVLLNKFDFELRLRSLEERVERLESSRTR